MADDITADVIIVGSGVAGAIMAAKLAAAGVKVAILEAGASVDRGEAVENYWNAVVKVPECPYPPVAQAMHPITDNLDYWYRQTGPDKFSSTYIKVVGGTTWHWLGTSLRLVPNDFRLKSTYGHGVDWPIGYDNDAKQGEATRAHLLGELARSHERIFAPHFPYPGVGTIVAKGNGYAFKPSLP